MKNTRDGYGVAIGLGRALSLGLSSGIAHAGCDEIYKRNCNGTAQCEQKRADIKTCENNEAAQRRAENERKQRAYEQKHKQEIDAVKKIEEANKAVKKAGVPDSSNAASGAGIAR
jgi:hypothetical protein